MKLLIATLAASLAFAGFAQAEKSEYKKKLYKLTLVNLTKGQPITPPVVAVHAPGYSVVHLGQPASQGLADLAQDGVLDTIVGELDDNVHVVRSAQGEGVILPGNKQEIIVEANNPHYQLTVLAMLARTNDAFTAAMNLGLKLRVGQKSVTLAKTYDAGVENNTELCAHIPAPPCNSHGVGTDGGEGFVRPHEGIINIGELDPARDAFAAATSKIIVERIQ